MGPFTSAKALLAHHPKVTAIRSLIVALAFASASLAANAATADADRTVPPPGTLVTLTPERAEAAKEVGARRNARVATLDPGPPRDRAVHGEAGVAIGTGGYRAIYGAAEVPLGDNAGVAISVEDEHYGGRRRRHR